MCSCHNRSKAELPKSEKFGQSVGETKKLLRVNCREHLPGVVIEHSKSLFDGNVQPNWLTDIQWQQEYPVVSLISKNKNPYANDIMVFMYFLAQVAGYSELAS